MTKISQFLFFSLALPTAAFASTGEKNDFYEETSNTSIKNFKTSLDLDDNKTNDYQKSINEIKKFNKDVLGLEEATIKETLLTPENYDLRKDLNDTISRLNRLEWYVNGGLQVWCLKILHNLVNSFFKSQQTFEENLIDDIMDNAFISPEIYKYYQWAETCLELNNAKTNTMDSDDLEKSNKYIKEYFRKVNFLSFGVSSTEMIDELKKFKITFKDLSNQLPHIRHSLPRDKKDILIKKDLLNEQLAFDNLYNNN